MSYFYENYQNVSYPIQFEDSDGLRNAQLGAIHAITSHFTLSESKPALVVMPTGSGKTAVLILTAFTQRAKRVLVITPSKLVRGQIYEEFSKLITLKRLKVIPQKNPTPVTYEVKKYLNEQDYISELNKYDVIVSTPNSIYESIKESKSVDENLFDLILVDEAHHSSAKSWKAILEYFKKTKKVLFTATPFRRDKKEIRGELVYSYPLSKAFDDKIFGEVQFYPLQQTHKPKDIELAKKAEEIFNRDREEGYDHYLFVRTNSKNNAKELLNIYTHNTKLNLNIIDSSKTFRHIKSTIKKLGEHELDGIICVDMLGEGFDFPKLKIAAIHSPHKSLAATLQFIGRFVRTNASEIGTAKFIAIEDDELEIENHRLYSQDSIWKDKIVDMSEGRIRQESEVREVLKTFVELDKEKDEHCDLSIYNLNPYFHAKIYKVDDFIVSENIEIPNQEIVEHYYSEEINSIIIISKETLKPKWILNDDLVNIKYNLFLIFYEKKNGLLFINSSIKTIEFYDFIVNQFTSHKPIRISKYQLNKVLIDIDDTEFFNIGLANRMGSSGESYKILTGPSTQNVLHKSDGRLYSNGHIFGRGKSNDEYVTIGYSSGSKIWSNCYDQIPNFIKWCSELSNKMFSEKAVKTNSGFDYLPIGQTIDMFPSNVFFVTWNYSTFMSPPIVEITGSHNDTSSFQLLDFEIEVIKNGTKNSNSVDLLLKNEIYSIPITYSFDEHFELITVSEFGFKLIVNSHEVDLDSYLNENPLQFYLTENFQMIMNNELHSPPEGELIPFDEENILPFDWENYGTDVMTEFGTDNSIHTTLKNYFLSQDLNIIIYDHGSGEIADFITIESEDIVKVKLYHVKASHGEIATSNRVGEVYEVAGQSVKSLLWLNNKSSFFKHIKRRTVDSEEKYLKGELDSLETILDSNKRIEFEIIVVQPGISKSKLTRKIGEILAASEIYILEGGNKKFTVWGSK